MKLCDFWKMFFGSKTVKFGVIQGDITQLGYQCVVNAANKELHRGGGVCGSIYRAAGPLLEWETDMYDPINPGDALLTGGYEMSEYVIHAVGPIYNENIMLELQNKVLEDAYTNALKIANGHNVETIAFPLISTGIYGYPRQAAIQVALDAIQNYIKENPRTSLNQIDIVCFTQEDYELVKSMHSWD